MACTINMTAISTNMILELFIGLTEVVPCDVLVEEDEKKNDTLDEIMMKNEMK